ncbi:hypothetical protein [Streptomyces sp. NPDC058240]|uniref:hypothetical protein n=1 Tax=Streptomyces sp. NPDC058240 TaxID=3346396 RepID=UPI0036E9F485
MGVTLDRLTRRRELGLTVPAGRAALGREVVWAHSIELADPTPLARRRRAAPDHGPEAARHHRRAACLREAAGRCVLVLRGDSPRRALGASGSDLAGRSCPGSAPSATGVRVLLLPGDGPAPARALTHGAASRLRPRPCAGLSDAHGLDAVPQALRDAAAAAEARSGHELVLFASMAGRVRVTAPGTRGLLDEPASARIASLADHDREQGTARH